MGIGNHDHRGLWRHGPKDVPGYVCGHAMRARRRVDRRVACAGHSFKLCHVLLAHPSEGQIAQKATKSDQRRAPPGSKKRPPEG